MLKVSVILTLLNEGEGLRALLDALFAQSRAPDEVVVVDGGSTDSTPAVLAEYRSRYPALHVFVDPGVNIARGRNLAIERASGDVLAVTDGGCLPAPQWLEELVRPLEGDPAVGGVAGRFEFNARNRFELLAGLLSTPRETGREEDRLFFGRSSAFRRELWEEVGGYPEWLYTAEDTLFARRAKTLGWKVADAPRSTVSWRPRGTWRKLAKQYYLYGKGTGRINGGSVAASLYHVRNHLAWLGSALLGFWFSPFWIITVVVLLHFYLHTARPAVLRTRKECADRSLELYVPAIVLVRSFFNNFGYLAGSWEYHFVPPFRRKLALYTRSTKSAEADAL